MTFFILLKDFERRHIYQILRLTGKGQKNRDLVTARFIFMNT
jgi:hypothetical protein